MREPQVRCDVCIVGAGALGLFAARELLAGGARVVLLEASKVNLGGLGVFWPSPNDPPTRAEVAHGHEMASYLCEVHAHGLALARKASFADTLAWQEAQAFRYGLEPFERDELQKASGLENFGLTPRLAPLGVQDNTPLFQESHSALLLDDTESWRRTLLEGLVRAGARVFHEKASRLVETTTGVRLETDRNRLVEAEIAVLGTASGTGTLLDAYSEILVPMTDALFLWERDKKSSPSSQPAERTSARAVRPPVQAPPSTSPLCWRGHNGHVAIAWNPHDPKFPLRISGPRFLWPGAGVGLVKNGALDARLRTRALDFHRAKTLPFVARCLGFSTWEALARREGLVFHSARFGVDCLPCDELPVVGEYGRWGRVLGASGFLASGLSAQLASARMLADLVETGTSSRLHPLLSPRRFRLGNS
ncbi:MAG: FAD-binding oxidoreductase [Silvanigrellales bacterium]|jgi:glycine/D-amino acid oxidase-like deaminating enzyme|nr:FAD-binding oxidoreductase [Silvanigrellales bacterium]